MNIFIFDEDLQEYKLLQALKQEGVPTLALVKKCSPGGKHSYYITYQYEAMGPDQQIEHYTKRERTGNCLKQVNSQINIRYLPQDPSQASIKKNEKGYNTIMVCTCLYFLMLMFTVYVFWILER